MGLLEDFLERGGVGWGVEDGLAAGAAIEYAVDDAAEIDAKSGGDGVGLAGKTRCLAISEAGPGGRRREEGKEISMVSV